MPSSCLPIRQIRQKHFTYWYPNHLFKTSGQWNWWHLKALSFRAAPPIPLPLATAIVSRNSSSKASPQGRSFTTKIPSFFCKQHLDISAVNALSKPSIWTFFPQIRVGVRGLERGCRVKEEVSVQFDKGERQYGACSRASSLQGLTWLLWREKGEAR